jgi:hypothetical protein
MYGRLVILSNPKVFLTTRLSHQVAYRHLGRLGVAGCHEPPGMVQRDTEGLGSMYGRLVILSRSQNIHTMRLPPPSWATLSAT